MIWRVRDRATFQALARAPRHRAGPISLRACFDGSDLPPRVAYSVGRRCGTAVDRNRIRRRLRAAVRECAGKLERGTAYLLDADGAVLTMSYKDLCNTIGGLLRAHREGRS